MAVRSLVVASLLVANAFFAAGHMASAQDFEGDAVIDQFADNIHKLFRRDGVSAPYSTMHLDGTMAGKAATAAVPSTRAAPMAAIRSSSSAARPLYQSFPLRGKPVPTFVGSASGGSSSKPRGSGVSERQSSGKQQLAQERPVGAWTVTKAAGETEVEVPYSINWFVNGDMSHADGMDPKKYMESKVADALKTTQSKIEAVDVRLTIEGHKPKTYSFEVTVKGPKGSTGTTVVSKSKHAAATFPEAVDDMHDTLKRNLLKDKEKRVSAVRQGDSLRDSDIVATLGEGDDQSEDENDPGKEEEEFFTKDPVNA